MFDGDEDNVTMATLCTGQVSDSYLSSGSLMTLIFDSHTTDIVHGFRAAYTAIGR